jgi:hypothetical protein
LPETQVILVDLVRVVRLNAAQPISREGRGDVEAQCDLYLQLVAVVEAAGRRGEEPDARRKFQIKFKPLQMLDQLR